MRIRDFHGQKHYPKLIGQGYYGRVYGIAKGYAAKVLRYTPLFSVLVDGMPEEEVLFKEDALARMLESGGISVPRPLGVFYIRRNIHKGRRPAFVMERIRGVTINKMPEGPEKTEAREKWEEEKRKVRALGLDGIDLKKSDNVIWRPDDRRVFLIDHNLLERVDLRQ